MIFLLSTLWLLLWIVPIFSGIKWTEINKGTVKVWNLLQVRTQRRSTLLNGRTYAYEEHGILRYQPSTH